MTKTLYNTFMHHVLKIVYNSKATLLKDCSRIENNTEKGDEDDYR